MKSTFAKYLTAFISITVVSFLMLAGIFTSMLRIYSFNEQDNVLRQTAIAIASQFEDFGAEDVELYIATGFPSQFVSALRRRDSDIGVMITDRDGAVLQLSLGEAEDPPLISGEIGAVPLMHFRPFEDDKGRLFYFHEGTVENIVHDRSRIYAYPITHEGETIGYSITLRSTSTRDAMMNVVYRAVLTSSLWVLLAAVIAVYFITERIVHPLRQMTRATTEYAKGDFTKRVEVYGRDEVSELAVAFNKMADDLSNIEKMRNSFLANVSHDLKTPMTTISGFISGITSGAIPPEKHEYYLGIIDAEVHRLSRLVSEILDVSRLESGEREFHFVDFDIAEVARLILISFEQKIEDKRLDVVFESDDTVMAYADKDAIYQVLYNLCHNAIKFAREGGILAIRIDSASGDDSIRVRVYDEGQWISEEDLPFVFDRFYKTDKSRGLDKHGVGLGLYICKTIMDQHRQSIAVHSEEGMCEFTFTLAKSKETPRQRLKEAEWNG